MTNERDAKKPQDERQQLQIDDLEQSPVTDEQADALRGGVRSGGESDVFSDPPPVRGSY